MDDKKEAYKKFLQAWASVDPLLESLRTLEIKNTNTKKALAFLLPAFESAQLHNSPSSSSGLVEQQKYFRKFLKGA